MHLLDETEACGLSKILMTRLANQAVAEERLGPCQVTVVIVNARESARLHRKHFGVNGMTDVMSFPDGSIDPKSKRRHLGDLVVCLNVAQKEGPKHHQKQGRLGPVEQELLLYICHGLLHLLGHDDQDEVGRQAMWDLQAILLEPFQISVQDR